MGVTDESVRFTLRLPEQLRDSLLKSSNDNHRSLNSELITVLESRRTDASDGKSTLVDELLVSCEKLSEDSLRLLVDLSRRMHS
jgi:hypothetical protein